MRRSLNLLPANITAQSVLREFQKITTFYIFFPCRKMVAKSLIAGLVVLLMAAVSLFLGVFMGLGSKNTPSSLDHFYSKAAVAADAGTCSEVGR